MSRVVTKNNLLQLFVFLLYFAFSIPVKGNRENLITYLFNKSRYDKRIMPSDGKNEPLVITLGLTVIKFIELVSFFLFQDIKILDVELTIHGVTTQFCTFVRGYTILHVRSWV